MERFAVFAVALIGSLGMGLASPVFAARIGFDDRNGFDANDLLASGSDFDGLRALITGLGHTIVPVASFDATSLAAANISALYLNQTYSQSYSATEISDIQAFVAAGNGLVLHGDGGAGFEATSMNDLASVYGVSFAATPTEPDGYEILLFASHPVTAGLGPAPGSGMCVDFQRTLTIASPATDLTTLGAPLAAAEDALAAVGTTAGAPGNVVIVSDGSAFNDADVSPQANLGCGENAVLAASINNFVVPIPEPGTFALFGLGLAVFARRRRSVGDC